MGPGPASSDEVSKGRGAIRVFMAGKLRLAQGRWGSVCTGLGREFIYQASTRSHLRTSSWRCRGKNPIQDLLTKSSQDDRRGKQTPRQQQRGVVRVRSAPPTCQVETQATPITQMRKLSPGRLRTLPKATQLQSGRVRICTWAVCLLRGCLGTSDRVGHPFGE